MRKLVHGIQNKMTLGRWVVLVLVVCIGVVVGLLSVSERANAPQGSTVVSTVTAPPKGAPFVKGPSGPPPTQGGFGSQLWVVQYKDGVFTPSTLTVSKGDTVMWANRTRNSLWPASNIHPTHTEYPGSDIKLCGTEDAKAIFDACGPIKQNGTYTFKFDKVGSWGYHNHLRPEATGMVLVIE